MLADSTEITLNAFYQAAGNRSTLVPVILTIFVVILSLHSRVAGQNLETGHNCLPSKYLVRYLPGTLGGLVVIVPTTGPKVHGFKP
jgi:hypothetical protein